MDISDIYVKYFSRKYTVICSLVEHILSEDKKIAVWGAGARGKAFLYTFDPGNEKIYCAFDIDEKRWNTKLPTGHVIMDYKEHPVNYIFVMNSINEVDVRETLINEGINAEVINIDNIILGDLGMEEIISGRKIN